MEVERCGGVVWEMAWTNLERRMSRDKSQAVDISKRRVLEAYWRVKANQGAAGIDGESLAMFEADLTGNLYKLWNRLSSGSYFPPPVKQVEVPKKQKGGVRVLGVPTVTS